MVRDRPRHSHGRPRTGRDQPYTPLGYSVGKWEGEALVITTTHIDWPYFELYGLVGVPQSRAMRIVERFTPRDGGATLKYDWSATDPAAFTETVTYEGYATFRWNPRSSSCRTTASRRSAKLETPVDRGAAAARDALRPPRTLGDDGRQHPFGSGGTHHVQGIHRLCHCARRAL